MAGGPPLWLFSVGQATESNSPTGEKVRTKQSPITRVGIHALKDRVFSHSEKPIKNAHAPPNIAIAPAAIYPG